MQGHASFRRESRNAILAVSLILAMTAMSACLAPGTTDGLSPSSATSTTTTSTTNTTTGDAYLIVKTAWELDPSNYETQGTCSTTGDGSSQTCIIHVPEGQLHFSNTQFVWGTSNTNMCARVTFRPGYHLSSVNAAYAPWWQRNPSPVDCSAASANSPNTDTSDCFYGAAKKMTGWPYSFAQYFSTSQGTVESNVMVPSSNAEDVSLGNILIANTMDDESVAVAGIYVASTNHSYRVECRDKYEQLRAAVDVYVADVDLETGEDPANPANDQWYDWNETL